MATYITEWEISDSCFLIERKNVSKLSLFHHHSFTHSIPFVLEGVALGGGGLKK